MSKNNNSKPVDEMTVSELIEAVYGKVRENGKFIVWWHQFFYNEMALMQDAYNSLNKEVLKSVLKADDFHQWFIAHQHNLLQIQYHIDTAIKIFLYDGQHIDSPLPSTEDVIKDLKKSTDNVIDRLKKKGK